MSCNPHYNYDFYETPYNRAEYKEYRSKFSVRYPFEDVIGKVNPYTDLPILSVDDYDLYCFCHYLKDASIDLHEDMASRIQILSSNLEESQKANVQLRRELRNIRIAFCFLLVLCIAYLQLAY